MTSLLVTAADSNQRLNKYIMKYLNNAPSSFIYKMLRKKNITLNGRKALGDEILKEGDEIKLFLSDETIAKFKSNNIEAAKTNVSPSFDIKILYMDDNILAVHKPAGILSQKADKNDVSINEIIIDYCIKNNIYDNKDNMFTPSICNRLDRNTSGIILAGISLHGSQHLSELLKEHNCDKYYYTVVRGRFIGKKTLKAYIKKDADNNVSNVISEEEYRSISAEHKKKYNYIESFFEGVGMSDSYSLLRVKLITGKSHQIRAGLKYMGFPVIGDTKYGDTQTNRYFKDKYGLKYHLLHAASISFDEITIIDNIPPLFEKICKGEGLPTNIN